MDKQLEEIVDGFPLQPVSVDDNRPYLILDGFISSVHQTLINIAIGRAAREVLQLNIGYITNRTISDHRCDRLYQQAGFTSINVNSLLGEQSILKKAEAYILACRDAWWNRKTLLDLRIDGLRMGDLVHDTIIRDYDGVFMLEEATYEQIRTKLHYAIRFMNGMKTVFDRFDVRAMLVGHKIYTNFGGMARMAVDRDVPLLMKTGVNIRRISSRKGLSRHALYLTCDQLDELISRVGEETLKRHGQKRLRGGTGPWSEIAHSERDEEDHRTISATSAQTKSKCTGLIAPHLLTEACHCGGEMIYDSYVQWLVRTVEITKEYPSIRWFVKAHPCSDLREETDVVQSVAHEFQHIRGIFGGTSTREILEHSDAVLTVRGTIGMEALLFNCRVLITGSAMYEEIPAITRCRDERAYRQAISDIDGSYQVPERDQYRARAALYYRHRSYHDPSPVLGERRPPGLTPEEVKRHDLRENMVPAVSFLEDHDYSDDLYYNKLLEFFESGAEDLLLSNDRLLV